jgi:VCBS repeat-containing protein
MTCAVLLAIPAVAFADQILGDADNDALAAPHPDSKAANQAPGATVSYDFSAYIRETGNTTDDVFKNNGDYVSVSINRSGDWLAANAGSPNTLIYTVYGDAFYQRGTVAVKVPCDAATGTSKTMTVTLAGIAKNAGADMLVGTADDVTLPDSRQLQNTKTFTYTITSSGAQDASCTPTNTAPVAVNDSYNTDEDTALNVAASAGVLSNDTDAQNNSLTAVLVSGPSHAATNGFTLNSDGSFNYTPAANFNGTDSFTYKANDGTADSNTVTVTINVASSNDAPTCQNVAVDTNEDDQGLVAPECSDDDGDALTYEIVDQAADGTATVDGDNNLEYDPDPNFNGSDSFTYRASDGNAFSDAATVNVTVYPVNDPPTTPGAITSTESLNNDGTFTLNWGTSTDVDGDNVTYTLEKRDANDANWSPVASGLASPSYTFGSGNALAEGTWDFRVKAVDSPDGAESDFSTAENLVKVDKSAPNAPTLSFATMGQSFKATVSGVDWYKDSAKIDVADNDDPALADTSDGSGVDADSLLPNPFNVTQNGTSTASRTVKDNVTNESAAGTLQVNVDAANPTLGNCPTAGPFLVNSGQHSVGPISANDGESDIDSANSQLTKSVDTSSTGTKTLTFMAKDNVGHSVTKNCDYTVNTHTFIGFSSPVDNPSYMNVMKAGQAVPLKWQLKDASGNPVTNLQSVTVKVTDTNCTLGTSTDQVEEFATGSSSLQNLGGGYYQFNWASPKSYANSCKTLTVNGVGVQQSALFKFTK